MQGKYRIFLAYFVIIFIGVLFYVVFVYFINQKINATSLESISLASNNPTTTQNATIIDNANIKIESSETKSIESESSQSIIQEIQESTTSYIVNVDVLNVRESPSTKSKILKKYIQNEIISIKSIDKGWGELDDGGFVYMEFVKEIPQNE